MSGTPGMDGLTSLAILKVNWDERRQDYLDNFIPFVEECLRRSEADEVSSKKMQSELKELVGFEIPQGVVRTLLRRLQGEGIRKIDNTYYRDADALNSEPLSSKSEDFQRETAALVEKLLTFSRESWEISWTEQEAEELLLDFVSRIAAPLLHARRFGDRTLDFNGNQEQADYIISAFVKRCLEKDPEGFEYLETIAKGAMMTNVVYYENPNIATEKLNDVAFYLDTPFLLDALGVNGDSLKEARMELINLLREAGAELYVFRDTVSEMRGVIDTEAKRSKSERKRRIPTTGNPIRLSLSSSDLRVLSESLVDRLQGMRIRVKEKPDFADWIDRRVDEGKLQDRLIEAGYNENKPTTLRHDVQAALAVFRLRKGQTPGRIENCTAAFVTTNPKLAYETTNFFADQLGNGARDAPPCLLNDDLATRVWLKMPNEAANLPRKQLLAHSYAALLPDDAMLDKYLQKVDEMREEGQVDEEEYMHLRSLKDVGHVVADVSLNEDRAFTEADVEEIRRRKNEEVQARAVEAEKRAERAEEKRKQEEERRMQKEEEARDATRVAERKGSRLQQQNKNIRWAAQWVGAITDWTIRILLFSLLAGGVFFALPKIPPKSGSDWWKVITTFFVVIAAIYGLYDAFTQARSWSRQGGEWMEGQIKDLLLEPLEAQE